MITSVSDTSWDVLRLRRALHPGQGEQVVDQAGHPGHRAAEVGQGSGDVGDHPVLQPLGERPQPGQRRPQIVGHEADQLLPRTSSAACSRAPGLGQRAAGRRQVGEHVGQFLRELGRRAAGSPGPAARRADRFGTELSGRADPPAPTCAEPRRRGASPGRRRQARTSEVTTARPGSTVGVVAGQEHQPDVDHDRRGHGDHRQQGGDDQLVAQRAAAHGVQQAGPEQPDHQAGTRASAR